MLEIINHYHVMLDSPLFWLYLASLIVDLVTGNIRAWVQGEVDSAVGVMGSLKHFGLFAFVIIFLPTLSIYIGDSTISQGLILYFIYQYIISIIENLGLLGFDVPDKLAQKFKRLKDDGDHRGSDS